jgi:hypothetical protein
MPADGGQMAIGNRGMPQGYGPASVAKISHLGAKDFT